MTPSQGIYAQLPQEDARLLFDVLNGKDPALAQQLAGSTTIPEEVRRTVESVVAQEFTTELDSSYEPTERGRALDALLRRFLERWPIPPE